MVQSSLDIVLRKSLTGPFQTCQTNCEHVWRIPGPHSRSIPRMTLPAAVWRITHRSRTVAATSIELVVGPDWQEGWAPASERASSIDVVVLRRFPLRLRTLRRTARHVLKICYFCEHSTHSCIAIQVSRSARKAAPSIGPFTITALAPAALALRSAWFGDIPCSQHATSTAPKQSPAPVGSI